MRGGSARRDGQAQAQAGFSRWCKVFCSELFTGGHWQVSESNSADVELRASRLATPSTPESTLAEPLIPEAGTGVGGSGSRGGTPDLSTSASVMWRNKWQLALTLFNNPCLIRSRKQHLPSATRG